MAVPAPAQQQPAPPELEPSAVPVEYLGVAGVARWFGVKPGTVTTWLARYTGWPEPDAYVVPGRNGDRDKLWLPEREPDWRAWKRSLPGQGAKGRPKPRRQPGDG
jgi:hypothetical protein